MCKQLLKEQKKLVKKKNNKNLKKDLIKRRLAEATLSLLKINSWQKISMQDIYKKAKINPPNAYAIVKNKKDILLLINNFFDNEVYKSTYKIEGTVIHDKIFEILMVRFEIFNIHRKAVIKLFNYITKKPDLIVFFIPLILNSLNTVLELSKVSPNGLLGKIKVEALLIIYLSVFLVWKKDESSNLEKTMVAIDNYLNKAETFMNLIKK